MTRRLILLPLLAGLLLSGCLAPAPVAPIPQLSYGAMDASEHPNLLILLRGIGASNRIFEEEGIIAEIRRRNLPFDIVAPDAHFGYYKSRSIDERLHEDIIAPARARGYRQVWLAGFSMGGMGGLFHLKYYPRDLDGILLTSPFLGWGDLAEEVRAAGGVQSWQAVTASEDQWERFLWSWIKEYGAAPGGYPPIYLGYGEDDILTGGGPALLATVLPAERVFSQPGNHTIATFKSLFLRHLDTLERLVPPAPATAGANSSGERAGTLQATSAPLAPPSIR